MLRRATGDSPYIQCPGMLAPFNARGGASSSVWVHYAPFPGACQYYFLALCASIAPSQKRG
nr:MAG TPA: hypothetical protein [Caudoviricetes sp.]